MKKPIYLLLLIFAVCGYARQSAPQPTGSPNLDALEHGQILYVAIPKDVPVFSASLPAERILDDNRFPGTGMRTAFLMKDAFTPYASQVIIGAGYEATEKALASAKAQNARYVFVPEFDFIKRRRFMWVQRDYILLRLGVKIFDTSQEGVPYSTHIQGVGQNEPSYRTEQEIDALKEHIEGFAKRVFEGAK